MQLKQRLKSMLPTPILQFRDQIIQRRQARKSPREIFSEVYRAKVWGGDGHDFFSGFGSHVQEAVDAYIAALRPVLVPELIERNKVKFADLNVDFRYLDITSDPIPSGDIALVRQVLQHLNNDQILNFLRSLRGYHALVVTEHLPAAVFKSNIDKSTGGGIRVHGLEPSGIILTDAPFNLKYTSMSVLSEVPEGDATLRTTAYYRPTL